MLRGRVSTLADGRELQAAFVLDASGYMVRVLAWLEALERDPRLEPRMALFGHVHDGIADLAPPAEGYRRDTILIAAPAASRCLVRTG